MSYYTFDFPLEIDGVKGFCPTGEACSKQNVVAKTISKIIAMLSVPVLGLL